MTLLLSWLAACVTTFDVLTDCIADAVPHGGESGNYMQGLANPQYPQLSQPSAWYPANPAYTENNAGFQQNGNNGGKLGGEGNNGYMKDGSSFTKMGVNGVNMDKQYTNYPQQSTGYRPDMPYTENNPYQKNGNNGGKLVGEQSNTYPSGMGGYNGGDNLPTTKISHGTPQYSQYPGQRFGNNPNFQNNGELGSEQSNKNPTGMGGVNVGERFAQPYPSYSGNIPGLGNNLNFQNHGVLGGEKSNKNPTGMGGFNVGDRYGQPPTSYSGNTPGLGNNLNFQNNGVLGGEKSNKNPTGMGGFNVGERYGQPPTSYSGYRPDNSGFGNNLLLQNTGSNGGKLGGEQSNKFPTGTGGFKGGEHFGTQQYPQFPGNYPASGNNQNYPNNYQENVPYGGKWGGKENGQYIIEGQLVTVDEFKRQKKILKAQGKAIDEYGKVVSREEYKRSKQALKEKKKAEEKNSKTYKKDKDHKDSGKSGKKH